MVEVMMIVILTVEGDSDMLYFKINKLVNK